MAKFYQYSVEGKIRSRRILQLPSEGCNVSSNVVGPKQTADL